jgi:hypothetical protein
MFNANIDALGNDTVPKKDKESKHGFHRGIEFSPNLLVEDDTHSSLGHVEHTPSLPVVKLVRHTLLKRTITLHTNITYNSVCQICKPLCEIY